MFTVSQTVFPPLGLVAANPSHSGGSSTGLLVAVVVLAVIGFAIFLASRNHPESDEQKQQRYQTELLSHLARLNEPDCRKACLWLAEGSLTHQEALSAALKATSGVVGATRRPDDQPPPEP